MCEWNFRLTLWHWFHLYSILELTFSFNFRRILRCIYIFHHMSSIFFLLSLPSLILLSVSVCFPRSILFNTFINIHNTYWYPHWYTLCLGSSVNVPLFSAGKYIIPTCDTYEAQICRNNVINQFLDTFPLLLIRLCFLEQHSETKCFLWTNTAA